jgi:hypothetical protein
MRPYLFKFDGRCPNEYWIDLNKVVAIGVPHFDTGDGLAFVTLTFAGNSELTTRFLTEYACTDPSVSTNDDRPMVVRKEVMRKTQEEFLSTVEKLKQVWTGFSE